MELLTLNRRNDLIYSRYLGNWLYWECLSQTKVVIKLFLDIGQPWSGRQSYRGSCGRVTMKHTTTRQDNSSTILNPVCRTQSNPSFYQWINRVSKSEVTWLVAWLVHTRHLRLRSKSVMNIVYEILRWWRLKEFYERRYVVQRDQETRNINV